MKNFTLFLFLIFGAAILNAQTRTKTITASKLYEGSAATVRLTIDLAPGHSGIIKPLIVAEGFDIGAVIDPENPRGYYSYSNFISTLGGTDNAELKELIYNGPGRQYDIIYVDWLNGVDYLQRNAYALEDVVKWVNAEKLSRSSTEQNVVLGQSMGGVIARYALADMEQEGTDHKTRLFVSHDAPQQGANIPISLQYLYRHINNQFLEVNNTLLGNYIVMPFAEDAGVESYLSILDAPASRQMLSNWIDSNYAINNDVFEDFYSELKSKGVSGSGGYPVNCRNISLSNGAECGTTQDFNPNDDLVNITFNKNLKFSGDLLSMIYLPLGGTVAGMTIDKDFFGVANAGLIPGKSKYNAVFNAKAIPYGSGNQIYKGKISYTKKMFWIGPNITVNITDITKAQPAGVLPFDTYGGGYYDTSKIAAAASDFNAPGVNIYIRNKFGFIPTASALDIGRLNVTLNDTDYKNAYVGAVPPTGTKSSPFANFSTDFNRYSPSASNSLHISFNKRNSEMLVKELSSTPITTNCSYMCTNAEITGSSKLCSIETYSAPGGASMYNWVITQGSALATLSGNGTPNVVLTIAPYATGELKLSLTMGDNYQKCGNVVLTKTINVGAPNIYYTTERVEQCTFNYRAMPYPGTTSNDTYVWEYVSGTGNATAFTFYSSGGFAWFTACPPFSIQMKLTAINACGSTEQYVGLSLNNDDEEISRVAPSNTVYNVFPNPSSDIVNIALNDETALLTKAGNVSGKLYDQAGKVRSKVDISKNRASFSVSNLEKGIYVLQLNIDNQIESHKIIVE